MSPRQVKSAGKKRTALSTQKAVAAKWIDDNVEEELACPLDSANKQATLKFVIKKKPGSSTKKCKSKHTDIEVKHVVIKKTDGDENNETDLATPNKNKKIMTPKRRLFTNDECSHSPSKRNCSPDDGITNSPKTPSSLLKKLELNVKTTPKSLKPKCLFEVNESSYCVARQALHASQPSSLPGREEHLQTLQNFLLARLKSKAEQGGALYLSGAPGTGKTASVTLTLQHPKIQSDFKIACINCTSIKTSRAIYLRVAEELGASVTGRTEKDCVASIQQHITHSKKKMLLVLDEVDQLASRHQAVLYTVFEWPALTGSQLTLVGIANSLDLTDRLLPRLQAHTSCRPHLLHYAPYTKQQISNILNHRLQEAGASQVFKGIAVEMLAAKVAAVSGDARRALDIGRRVVELADAKQSSRECVLRQTSDHGSNTPRKSPRKENTEPISVGIADVRSVLDGVYGTTQSLVSSDKPGSDGLPMQQKLLVCALLLLLRKGNNKEITVGKLHEVYSRVCSKRKLNSVSQSECYSMCTLVETRGIVHIAVNKKDVRLSKILLQWDDDEVSAALCDKDLLSSILSDVSCLSRR